MLRGAPPHTPPDYATALPLDPLCPFKKVCLKDGVLHRDRGLIRSAHAIGRLARPDPPTGDIYMALCQHWVSASNFST